jgi:hypothetical protein
MERDEYYREVVLLPPDMSGGSGEVHKSEAEVRNRD